MKNLSLLQMIPTYRALFIDANIILTLFTSLMVMGNVALLFVTNDCTITLFVSTCGIIGILAILTHARKVIPLLKNDKCSNYYFFAILEYLMLIIGFCPLYLYLYIDLQWQLLNKQGLSVLPQFNQYIYWMFPVATFLLISITYWIVIFYLKKESNILYLLEKSKSTTYEI